MTSLTHSMCHMLSEAQWCGPCQMMQPILEDVANRLENDAKVAKVDTDKAPKLGLRYQVNQILRELHILQQRFDNLLTTGDIYRGLEVIM